MTDKGRYASADVVPVPEGSIVTVKVRGRFTESQMQDLVFAMSQGLGHDKFCVFAVSDDGHLHAGFSKKRSLVQSA